jgi:hypothetical protein
VQDRGRDRCGRTVGAVWLDDKFADLSTVAKGIAWHHERYDKSRKVAEAEGQVRASRRGLWADANLVPAWRGGSVIVPSNQKRNGFTSFVVRYQRLTLAHRVNKQAAQLKLPLS